MKVISTEQVQTGGEDIVRIELDDGVILRVVLWWALNVSGTDVYLDGETVPMDYETIDPELFDAILNTAQEAAYD